MSSDYKQLKLYRIRHSCEHIFNQAIEELFPGKVLRAMGPAIENGWYNDSRWAIEISEKDFPKIEKRMQKIINANFPLIEKEISADEVKEIFKNNPFKLELINEYIADRKKLTVYYTGDPNKEPSSYKKKIAKESAKDLPGDVVFVDLCKGPHVNSTSEVKVFKLLSIAGAYWRGDEKNEMLTRVYGTAFESKKDLNDYLDLLENQKERDHRKINEKMDLFAFSDIVGKGLVMFTPKGTLVKNLLKNYLFEVNKEHGGQEVSIPHMAKIDLYEKSGHAKKFKDELFFVRGHYDNEYVMKPVNCPHHTQIYASRQRSYKDLPIAYIESTQQHRDEKPGAMSGLNRTASFEVDDGHTFCTPDQIKEEAKKIINVIKEFYTALGMWGDHWVSLSFRDPNKPEDYIGDEDGWILAQKMLKELNKELKLNGEIIEGEAALYGPKIDFMLKDVLGNDRQLGTVQIDFAMPKNFELEYIDKDGIKKTPVMLHRAILGSYQRFIAYLMESTKGAFPVWLHPEQVAVLPVSEKHVEYSNKLSRELIGHDIRVYKSEVNETLGNKIRKAQEMKIPYMLIIGDKEVENKTVNVRLRTSNELGEMNFLAFTQRLQDKIKTKSLDL